MVWILEALEVHYFSIKLTLRRNFEIKHMFRVNNATAKPYVNILSNGS
jgi:hypothetical protein